MFLDRRLWTLTRGLRGRIALTVLVGVLASTVGVARFALLGWLLARLYADQNLTALWGPLTAIAVVMGLRGVLEYARARLAHETSARVQLHLRARLHDHVVALGPAWFNVERSSDAMLSLGEGVEQLETYFGEYLPQLFIAAITPVIIFAIMAGLDVPLAFMLLGFAWFALIAPAAFSRWDTAASLHRREAYQGLTGAFLDAIQGLPTLKAFGQTRAQAEALSTHTHEVYRSTLWVQATNAMTRGITDTAIAVGTAATLAVGAYRVDAGTTSVATLLMILMAGVETFRPQRELRSMLHDGMLGLSAAQGIFRILESAPLVQWSGQENLVDTSLELDAVSFSYPEQNGVTHDSLSFSVCAGERVGVVGSSGAGKSTIVKLLMRQYDPQAGVVRIGQRDVRAVAQDTLLRNLAVVAQDTYLFHGTVEDNLRFGRPNASPEDLTRALDQANATEFVDRLPQGMATIIGERGVRLSGGQRQRIAIARAFLRDAPILILDEALSAVDARNEAEIQTALQRLMKNRTTLIIAHRLSSVIDCDRILVLDKGAVVEQGTHESLLQTGHRYQALMAPQIGSLQSAPAFEADASRSPESPTPPPTPFDVEGPWPKDSRPSSNDGKLGAWAVMRSLGAIARPYAGSVAATLLLGIARVAAFIGVGVVSAGIVAAVQQGVPFDDRLVLLFMIAPAAGILHWFESWLAHDMAFRMLSRMRIQLFDKLARIAPAFLLRRRSGDLVALATHDVERTEYFFAHTLAPAFVAVLVPGTVLAVLVALEWTMAAALIPFLMIVAASPLIKRKRFDDLAARARACSAHLTADVVDSLQGLHEVIAYQQADHRKTLLLHHAHEHLRLRLSCLKGLALQKAALEVAVGLGGLAVIIAGAHSASVAPELLPVLTLLAIATFLPVSEIAHVGRQLSDTVGATRRLHAIHEQPEPIQDGHGGIMGPLPTRHAALEFDDVRFSYPGHSTLALDAVAFEATAGHMTAIVGRSGAGKTTVTQLCMRFFDPSHGQVRVLGHDARRFRLDDLRARIALVGQDTYLFNDTIEANLRLARPDASPAQLTDALERAALASFVDSLPDGLATRVGERGLRLSGGQRQRFAIARALLKDAPLLILDEATSHLDAVNEAAIQRSLETLMSHRTTVVIAHRLSTVQNANRIVVLNQGHVVQTGTHEALVRAPGEYRALVSSQIRLVGTAAA